MEKELKSLGRKELIDIIYQLKKNEQALREENDDLRRRLENRRIKIADAGSLATAALALSDVFSSAQRAADAYLNEIKMRLADAETEEIRIIAEANAEAERIIEMANERRREIFDDGNSAYRLVKVYEAEKTVQTDVCEEEQDEIDG